MNSHTQCPSSGHSVCKYVCGINDRTLSVETMLTSNEAEPGTPVQLAVAVSWVSQLPLLLKPIQLFQLPGHTQTQMEQGKEHVKGRSRQGRNIALVFSCNSFLKSLKFPSLATHPSSRWQPLQLRLLFLCFHHSKVPSPLSLSIKPGMIENRETVSHRWGSLGVIFLNKNMHNSVAGELFLGTDNEQLTPCKGPGSIYYQLSKRYFLGRQMPEQS